MLAHQAIAQVVVVVVFVVEKVCVHNDDRQALAEDGVGVATGECCQVFFISFFHISIVFFNTSIIMMTSSSFVLKILHIHDDDDDNARTG